jgi:hypothetical protein
VGNVHVSLDAIPRAVEVPRLAGKSIFNSLIIRRPGHGHETRFLVHSVFLCNTWIYVE